MEYDSRKKEEEYWKTKLPHDSDEILETLNPAVRVYSTSKELFMLLHKGFFFDNGERFFSINDDGKKCEIISAKRFVKQKSEALQETSISGQHLSRLPVMRLYPHTAELNLYFRISTSMLSMDTMYAASLVFSFKQWDTHSSLHIDSSRWVWIKWKCEDLCVSSAHFAIRRDDGNFETTLWQFFSSDKNSYFDIILNRLLGGEEEKLPCIIIHRLEFHPLKMAKIQDESTFDEDFNHENKLPSDYEGIICRTDTRLKHTTQKDLYFLLCAGILIDNGTKWFCLCKSTSEKCHMLAAVDIFRNDSNYELMDRLSLSESRFKEGIQLQNATQYYFTCELETDMFSSGKLYEIYLVFKFVNGDTKPDADCLMEAYCELNDEKTSTIFAHLSSCEPIPVIKPKKKNTKLRNLWNMPKSKGRGVPKWSISGTHNWMKQRNDGWMEVLLSKPFDELEKYNSLNIKLRSLIGSFYGTIVQAIEFRPMERGI
ncbi:hypothetical protein E3N88_33574 [Mikania micrantha]|uniref:Uncharacterized protein n=1 Tax=Mikania micrantha TaxID=192012 RepID=A0A5N6MCD4_9ASTR|nr:hypothetical protein E3N88_33574 [Mikania micrantha]